MSSSEFNSSALPSWKVGLFVSHCVIGVGGIGYFTYKTFLNRNENVYDKRTKSFKLSSPLFRNICKTVHSMLFRWVGVLCF